MAARAATQVWRLARPHRRIVNFDLSREASEPLLVDGLSRETSEAEVGVLGTVISLLEVVENDFSGTLVKVVTEEADAAFEFELTTQENVVFKTMKDQGSSEASVPLWEAVRDPPRSIVYASGGVGEEAPRPADLPRPPEIAESFSPQSLFRSYSPCWSEASAVEWQNEEGSVKEYIEDETIEGAQFFGDLSAMHCVDEGDLLPHTASDFESRQHFRAEEIDAIEKAFEFVSSDVASACVPQAEDVGSVRREYRIQSQDKWSKAELVPLLDNSGLLPQDIVEAYVIDSVEKMRELKRHPWRTPVEDMAFPLTLTLVGKMGSPVTFTAAAAVLTVAPRPRGIRVFRKPKRR